MGWLAPYELEYFQHDEIEVAAGRDSRSSRISSGIAASIELAAAALRAFPHRHAHSPSGAEQDSDRDIAAEPSSGRSLDGASGAEMEADGVVAKEPSSASSLGGADLDVDSDIAEE